MTCAASPPAKPLVPDRSPWLSGFAAGYRFVGADGLIDRRLVDDFRDRELACLELHGGRELKDQVRFTEQFGDAGV